MIHPKSGLRLRFSVPLVLCLLFFAWRFIIFLSAHPIFFHDDYEEVYRGIVAREIAGGTTIPLWRYRPDNYAGGFYVIVTLLSVFQKAFGFSMFGLKTFGILQTAGTMLVWYAILARYVNRRTAVLFSLLYIFAPFRYITLSSLVFGDHAETCFLSALTVWLLLRMFEHKPENRLYSYAALGILAGFSLWFAYIYAVTLAAVAVFLVLNHRPEVFSGKNLAIAALSFLVGFSFWIIFNFSQGFTGLVVQGAPLSELFKIENLISPLHSWREFFFIKLLTLPDAPGIWHPFYNSLLVLYVGLLAISVAAAIFYMFALPREKKNELRRGPVVLALIYTLLFLAIQQTFDAVGLRFLVPLFPFVLALIAYGLAELYSNRKAAAFLIAGAFILLAVSSSVLRFAPEHFGEYLSRKGYSVKTLGHALDIYPRIEAVISGKFSDLRSSDKTGYVIAYVGQLDLEDPGASEEILKALEHVEEEYRGYFAYLAGREIMLRQRDLVAAARMIEPLREKNLFYYEQAAKGVAGAVIDPYSIEEDLENIKRDLPPDIAARLTAYEGFELMRKLLAAKFSIEMIQAEILSHASVYTGEEKERFIRGCGRYFFYAWSLDPRHSDLSPRQLMEFSPEIRPLMIQGVGVQMLRKHLLDYSSPLIWSWNEFYRDLDGPGREHLREGVEIALERWKLPREILPTAKLNGLEPPSADRAEKNTI